MGLWWLAPVQQVSISGAKILRLPNASTWLGCPAKSVEAKLFGALKSFVDASLSRALAPVRRARDRRHLAALANRLVPLRLLAHGQRQPWLAPPRARQSQPVLAPCVPQLAALLARDRAPTALALPIRDDQCNCDACTSRSQRMLIAHRLE